MADGQMSPVSQTITERALELSQQATPASTPAKPEPGTLEELGNDGEEFFPVTSQTKTFGKVQGYSS